VHLFDLRQSSWLRTKRREAHEMYRFYLSPEWPNLDREERVWLTFLFVFIRETAEKFGVCWRCRELDLV
jgi:hypothetical protein